MVNSSNRLFLLCFAVLGLSLQSFAQQADLKAKLAKAQQAKMAGDQVIYHSIMSTMPTASPEPIKYATTPSYNSKHMMTSTACDCWIERDASFTIAPFTNGTAPEYRNDDGSTANIPLPFTFCFYGTNHNACFINNNGNISFNSGISTFSSDSFPITGNDMVAAFWGDVDTRNVSSGLVYYKITPHYMIVQWDSVGYFSQHIDKFNTFQIIISDGTDPIISGGNNVSFCYKDMQWTTGDVSPPGNVGGFGGVPATVGANKGDNVNFVQFGRFDNPSTNYDGPFGVYDGVSWLDNQNFTFNTCFVSNIPPSVTGFSPCGLDTFDICVGDTFSMAVTYYSPEPTQDTRDTATSATFSNFTFTADPPATTSNISIAVFPAIADTGYHVITFTGTDNGTPNLSTSGSIVIHVIPQISVDAGPEVLMCPGDTTILNALTTAGGVHWFPPDGLMYVDSFTTKAFPMVSTWYYVTATSGGTCLGLDSVYVGVTGMPCNAGPDQNLCVGFVTTLNASPNTAATYTWSPATGLSDAAISNPTANPNITTTYTVTVVDNFNCVTHDDVTVSVVPALPADAGLAQTTCSNDSVILNATGGTIFSWSPTIGIGDPNIGNTAALPGNTTTYTVFIQDATGCAGSDTVTIAIELAPTIDAGSNYSICPGSSATLNGSGSEPGYSWSPGTFISNTSIPNPVVNPDATTWYTLTMLSPNGCDAKDSAQVTIYALPVPLIGSDQSICAGNNVVLGGGTLNYSCLWSPAAGLSSTTDCAPTASPTNTTTYTLTVTDNATTCINDTTVTVNVNPVPTVNASANVTVCNGASSNLTVSGATSYSWVPFIGLSSATASNTTASPTTTTTYSVIGTNTFGCSSMDVVTVTVGTPPNPSQVNVTPEKCGNSDGKITVALISGGFSPYTYSLNGGPFQSSNNFPDLDPGTYTLVVKDAFNCTASKTILVDQYLGINADFSATPLIGSTPLIVNFTNNSTGASGYHWDYGTSNATDTSNAVENPFTYTQGGIYTIMMIAYNNTMACSDTDTLIISAIDLFTPNVFMPGSGNGNDQFFVRVDGLAKVSVQIFNRWGVLVNEWSDIHGGWDGKMKNGNLADDGTYYYVVDAMGLDGKQYQQHGFVELVSP